MKSGAPLGVSVENEDLDYGDYEYDIVPTGYAGFGDMEYSVVPALDEFGLGYGDFGDYSGPSHKLNKRQRRRLKRFLARMRRAPRGRQRKVLNKLRSQQRRFKKMGVFARGVFPKRRYAMLVRKIKALRRLIKRPIKSAPPSPPRRRLVPIRPAVANYVPVKPKLLKYKTLQPMQRQYAPIDTATSVYAPIQPGVQNYGPVPMASEAGASSSPVVRIRQSAGSQAPPQQQFSDEGFDFDDEEFESATAADPDEAAALAEDAAEEMDGYGGYGAKFGGVVATKKNYIRVRAKYFKLRKKKAKKGDLFRKNILKALYKKLRNIEKKNAYQIKVRRAKGKKPFLWQGKLRRYINKVGGIRKKLASLKPGAPPATPKLKLKIPPLPPGILAPPPPPKRGETFAAFKARMRGAGWKTPPANFLARSKRGRFRWNMWNKRSRRALALRRAYYSRNRRPFPTNPYMPIPRPMPQYRPIYPPMQQYAPVRMPGPNFAPIVPPMQQYAPVPLPQGRTYAPVGTQTPYSYTYTTAQAGQPAFNQAAANAARLAVQQSNVATEVSDDADMDEQEGIGLGKIALGIGVIGAGAYFISKGKKGKKKKKTAPVNGRG